MLMDRILNQKHKKQGKKKIVNTSSNQKIKQNRNKRDDEKPKQTGNK
jgi:hypothetical protein